MEALERNDLCRDEFGMKGYFGGFFLATTAATAVSLLLALLLRGTCNTPIPASGSSSNCSSSGSCGSGGSGVAPTVPTARERCYCQGIPYAAARHCLGGRIRG